MLELGIKFLRNGECSRLAVRNGMDILVAERGDAALQVVHE